MTDRLVIPISQTADLVITKDNKLSVSPGLMSYAAESIEIGPLSDEIIEQFIYALQSLRVHA